MSSHPGTLAQSKRLLSGKDLFFMAMGQTIGAGIITNTGLAIALAGSGVILAYLMAFFVTYVGNFPNLLFATVNPVRSPAYVSTSWLNKKLGGYWLYTQIFAALAQAYMGSAFGAYIHSIAPSINPNVAACVIVVIFYITNLFDLKTSAMIQNVTTAFLLLTIASFIVLGAPKCDLASMFQSENFFYGGWLGIFNGCALVLFGVGGCSLLPNFGPDMENPRRNIPKMTTIVYICAFFAFGLVAFVGSGVAPIAEVAGKPMTYQATIIYPGNGYLLFVIGGALLAIVTTINSNFARYWATIIRGVDEGWLPGFFGRRNKHGIPVVLHTMFFLMAFIPNAMGMNIGALAGLASAISLVPQLIPVWGFVLMPDRVPESWRESKISRFFASRGSRILLCSFSTILIGIFVVLNVLNFSRSTTIFFIAYFVITGVLCFGFGSQILESGAKRLAEREKSKGLSS